jgi:nicotinate phosphoribosyltransferase
MEANDQVVTMQMFQKNHATLCGIDEAIAILKTCSGSYSDQTKANLLFDTWLPIRNSVSNGRLNVEAKLDALWEPGWNKLEVKALFDGDDIQPYEPVLQITGPYSVFAHLESIYLGIPARQTKVATNVRKVTDAANGKPVLFFADRFDFYGTQGGDGYAAKVGGAQGWATDAMGAWWGEPGMGTMPHALIAARHGSLTHALNDFYAMYPDVNQVALVDFHNDCVAQSLEALETLGKNLYAVRLDTSEKMVDESLKSEWEYASHAQPHGADPKWYHGVTEELVRNVRDGLDKAGGQHVKIVVSGGFNAEKIQRFELANVPVDIYAVGESLLRGSNAFTADVVVPTAKVGRGYKDDTRLELVT